MIVFVVPVHDRHELANACLRQLRRVCDELGDATAVMVGDDHSFKNLAVRLGFSWVWSENQPLGKKWNSGIYYAGVHMNADHIVRFGSDDIIHPGFFAERPPAGTIACTRNSAIVNPAGDTIASLHITYEGGDGVQIVPRDIYEKLRFRPCLENRDRAVDGSITQHLQLTDNLPRFDYRDTDPLWIVDFKTATPDQRNTYAACVGAPGNIKVTGERCDVWEAVASVHGELCAAEIAKVYGKTLVAHGDRLAVA